MSILINNKYKTFSEYLALAFACILTLIAIYKKEVSVFYILYLFWWDEFLKTIFDIFRYFFKKPFVKEVKLFVSGLRSRLFFLFIYIIFIIIFFGFMMDWNNENLLISNFEVLFFKNWLFNMSLFSFLTREIYLYQKENYIFRSHTILSRGIITLHISIILGVFLWVIISAKLQNFEDFASVLAIIPFLLLKIFFEVQEIQQNLNNRELII